MGRARYRLRTLRRKAWAEARAWRRRIGVASIRRSWPPTRRAAAIGLVAGALVLGVGTWLVAGQGGDRSPQATVRAFFEARREGDCDRLLDLVSEDSWSEGGRLGRGQFVERCAAVVRRYRPELDEVASVGYTGDERAVVQVSVPVDGTRQPAEGMNWFDGLEGWQGLVVTGRQLGSGEDRAHGDAHLVREGGDWKVEIDPRLMRLGRSVEETVVDYIEAFNEGDCDRLVGHLSRSARQAAGATGAGGGDELVDRCTADVEARREDISAAADAPAGPEIRLPSSTAPAEVSDAAFEVTFPAGDATRAVAEWGYLPHERVPLVREGLVWKLDQPHLAAERYIRLRQRVLPEPAPGYTPGSASATFADMQGVAEILRDYEGADAGERRREAGFVHGLQVGYQRGDDLGGSINLVVYEFDGTEGARVYARHLAERAGSQIDYRVPPLPVADAFRTVTHCGDDDTCQHAYGALAVGVEGDVLIAVEVRDGSAEPPPAAEVLGVADQVLAAQRARVADMGGGH